MNFLNQLKNNYLIKATTEYWPYDMSTLVFLYATLFLLMAFLLYRLLRKKDLPTTEINSSTKTYKISSNEAFRSALKKTRDAMLSRLDAITGGSIKNDEEFFTTLEESLVCSDIGIKTVRKLIDSLKENPSVKTTSTRIEFLKNDLVQILEKIK